MNNQRERGPGLPRGGDFRGGSTPSRSQFLQLFRDGKQRRMDESDSNMLVGSVLLCLTRV